MRERDRQAGAAARRAALADELGLWSERAQAAEAQVTALSERQAALADELTKIAAEPEARRAQHTELKAASAAAESRRRALQDELATGEATLAEAQAALDRAETERFDAREATARLEGRLERAQAEYQAAEAALRSRFGQLPADPLEPPPDGARLAELEAELGRLGAARDRLGPVNLRAIDEAEELAQKLGNLQAEAAELTDAIERLRRAIAALNREGRERLRAAFARVEEHFEALFVRLFGGGRARLSLTDLEDPLAAGLELAASPPGKKLQSVSLLSGGEKALTAIALIFAVFLTRPAPLCVLDEVDAPLDDANVERLGDLLEELAASTDTRFIVITHHPLTMARMDRLYGVTMVERGISQLVSVDLRRAVELRASA
jgi:chromosome segregation protein